MLALRTMAGDELKDEVNNATSICRRSSTNAIWKLTSCHVLTEPLELKLLCENIAFAISNNYKSHMSAQLLIGQNYADLKSCAFSLT